MEDYRLKRVFLDPNNLVRALNWLHAPGDSCLVVGGPQVPEDATVDSCYYDPSHRGLIVVFSHPSFEQVHTGEQAPWLDAAKGSTRFILRKPEAQDSAVLIDVEKPTPVEGAPVEEESGGDFFRRVMGT